jgi:hypothetical protein
MNPTHSSAFEIAASGAANKATWAGSAVTVLSGVSSSDIGVWAGILIGVGGLAISWYFKYRADVRYQEANARYVEAHQAYMNNMAKGVWAHHPPTPKKEDD